MASLTGQLVAETYKALLKTIDNDILTASEKQITDGFGGGSNVFIDSQGFLRANKYKVTNGLATQFLKADGSLDANTYLTGITSSQIITALGYTPVTNARTLTINGTTYDLSANRSWTIAGTAAVWGNISGTLSNQTDLQNALNAKFNNPTGTISQYIRGDGTLATLPSAAVWGNITGTLSAQTDLQAALDAKFDDPTGNSTQYIDGSGNLQTFPTMLSSDNLIKLVRNQSGATMTAGTIVYINGATGNKPTIAKALATSDATSAQTYGMVQADIANNADGYIVVIGNVNNLNTHSLTEGAQLYLSATTAGAWTTTKQYAPNHLVYVGIVLRSHPNQGIIGVKIQNGYEMDELHDVSAQTPSNNDGLFFETSTSLWKNKSITDALGFVPQRLDKMVSNLLASATEYPNSNAVIAALALKADAANPVFTGNMTISGAEPKLYFVDTDQNPDYTVLVDAGYFKIYDQTAGATRFQINSDGNISTGIGKSITAGSFIKESGTASQFLKADGSIDSNTYVSSAVLADYLLSATAATTYQTLANLSTDLAASATKYPSVNAVVAGLNLKQPLDADLTAIAALTGTSGFLKKTAADTWSLDTSTYLTTAAASTTYLAITTAASTYQRLDKMVSNLLASDTEYPNSNAVLAKLALKADAANPVFTGDMTISGISPKLYFTDTDNNPDYTLFVDSGYFYIYDQTAGATKFQITPSGNSINTGTLTSASFIKSGGTSSQYLMADGSVSTLTNPVTGSGTTNYLSKWTSGSALGNSLVFDNGTNVIIGTNVAQIGTSKLEVIGTVAYNGVVRFINSVNQGDVNHGTLMIVNSANYAIGNDASIGFALNNSSNSNLDPRASIGVKTSGNLSGDIVFNTRTEVDYTEKVRIFSGGNFAIGTQTNSGFKLDVNGTGRFSSFLNANAQTTAANGSINVESLDPAIRFRVTGGTANRRIYEWRAVAAGGVNDIMQLRLWTDAQNSADTLFTVSSIGAGTFYNTLRVNSATKIGGTGYSDYTYRTLYVGQRPYGDAFSIINMNPSLGDNNYGFDIQVNDNGTAGSQFFGILNNRDGAQYFKIFGNGNVAINSSTDAGYKLDVNGTGRFANSLGINISGTAQEKLDINGALAVRGSTAGYATASAVGVLDQPTTGITRLLSFGPNTSTLGSFNFYIAGANNTSGTTVLTIANTGAATFSSSVTATSGYINGSILALYHGSKFAVGGKLLLPASSDNDIGGILYGYWDTTSYPYEGGLKFQSFKYNGTGYAMADAMTINGQGRVGIGTTNPNRQFVVSNGGASGIELSAGSSTATIISYNRSLGAWQPLILQEGTGNVLIGTSTDSGYRLNVNGVTNSSSGFRGGGGFFTTQGQANNTPSVPSASIGVYADTYAFIELSTSNVNGGWIDFSKADGGDFTGRIRYYNNPDRFGFHTGGGSETITFSSGGNITATAFFESSDIRLKTLIDGSAQIAGIENLEAKLYEKNGKLEFGYFAQDAEKLMPFAVEKNADGFLTLSYREVHTAKIARLEKRVAELEKQLNLN